MNFEPNLTKESQVRGELEKEPKLKTSERAIWWADRTKKPRDSAARLCVGETKAGLPDGQNKREEGTEGEKMMEWSERPHRDCPGDVSPTKRLGFVKMVPLSGSGEGPPRAAERSKIGALRDATGRGLIKVTTLTPDFLPAGMSWCHKG